MFIEVILFYYVDDKLHSLKLSKQLVQLTNGNRKSKRSKFSSAFIV